MSIQFLHLHRCWSGVLVGRPHELVIVWRHCWVSILFSIVSARYSWVWLFGVCAVCTCEQLAEHLVWYLCCDLPSAGLCYLLIEDLLWWLSVRDQSLGQCCPTPSSFRRAVGLCVCLPEQCAISCALSGSLNVPLHQGSGSVQSGSPIMAVIHAMSQHGMGLGVLRILIFYVGWSASDCVFVPSECCHRCN